MGFIGALSGFIVGILWRIVISFLFSWPVYMLWNGCLVDAVDIINDVTWLQAWGISILCNLLFKSSKE